MISCAFLGHRDCSENLEKYIFDAIEGLIKENGVLNFYVGNHGNFDSIVLRVLRRMKKTYPQISYAVVLAYLPRKKTELDNYYCDETLFPEGLESVPPRFAISYRNKWMIFNSDYVIAYLEHTFGCTAKFIDFAKARNKTVIYIRK